MRNVILYRGTDFEKDEMESASWFFDCTNRRPFIQKDDLVIGRYSSLPYYLEQAKDISYVGAQLINSYQQYQYIADLGNYIIDLDRLTPQTWRNIEDIPEKGPFVLKGETNSRKGSWLKDMYAETKKDAIEVYNRLTDDSLIGNQKVYIRKYVPLVKYLDGINGAPVTKEFRFFIAYGQVLCGAFYWSNYVQDIGYEPSADEVPADFLFEVMERVGTQSNFYTIDVGQTASGEWIVIELNDGQMAGLSCNDPFELYKNLSVALSHRK
jgi:ATP-grasp domain, R2K clade family 3